MAREVKKRTDEGMGKKKSITGSSSGRPSSKSKSKAKNSLKSPERNGSKSESFFIAGIGASAGGLEAFTDLLRNLPAETGMAFVLVQHLDPKHESMMTDLLSRKTAMPVREVKDAMIVEPDQVYVMPPNTDMTISHGILKLTPRTEVRGHHMPIDRFLNSLAEDQKSHAIGVILSGTASDGAQGLRLIKARGGITFAQDERSAKYGGMPHSAVAAGGVDLILPPEKIARELVRVSRHLYSPAFSSDKAKTRTEMAKGEDLSPKNGNDLGSVFNHLESHAGVDFTQYKHATLKRRILRRMALLKTEDVRDYLKYLQGNPDELKALYHDVLINVTGFFRDAEAFEALEEKVFPEIAKDRGTQMPIRIWVPGCSTGEEAYSLAISLVEYLGRKATDIPFQIFASDLSNWAIDKARTGKYPENIAQDLSPERLKRFFVRVDSGYQVVKSIRERCVFARHDLTRDPPFSNLDLISCRNVLIYMGPVLQKRAMAVFHYSLKPTGYLLLGKSEAVGRYPDLFTPVDRKFKIYSRKPTSGRPAINLPHRGFGTGKTDIRTDTGDGGFDFKKEADLILLSKAPAGVIVDDRLEIIHFHGQTGHYLEPPPGDASFNLLRMAREGIKLTLRTAIHKAKKQGAPVRNEGLQVKFNGHLKEVNIEVIPLKASHPGEGYLLILFEDRPVLPLGEPDAWKTRPARDKGTRRRTDRPEEKAEVSRLEQELEATKKHLQSIIEESDTLNEEMRAANEEVQSSNEELQSLNEELETSKEELESTNEELTTLNDELQNRNIALDQLNNDVINLLTSVNLPVIMLESDLCIRRFTPIAAKLLSLTPTDIGRSITHVRLGMNIPGLETSILEVINTGVIKEAEVQDWEGIWYSMRISPYRTVENRIGGAVLTWLDIHALKRSVELTKESRDYAEAIVETVREPLVVLDGSLRVKTANRSFYRIFQTLPGETEGRLFYELGNRQWDMPEIRSLFEEILSQGTSFQDFDVEIDFPAIGHKAMQLNAKPIVRGDGGTQMILLAIEDVTEQKRMEEIMRESEVSRRLSSRVMGAQEEERKRMAHEIHDGIGQSLSAAKFKIESILKKAEKDEGEAGAHLYEAILPILHENIEEARRIQMGLRPSILDDMGILPTITWFCREFQKTYPNIRIETDVTIKEEEVSSFLKTTAYRLMQEALNNVAKHSKADLVYLALHKVDDKIQLKIRDNGKGFDVKEALSIESSRRGFGLTSMRERVEISGGVFALESVEGKGTTITASWKVADKPF